MGDVGRGGRARDGWGGSCHYLGSSLRPGAAHFPVVGVMRAPWPLDDMPSNIESILAIKKAVYQPVQPREAVRVKGASRPLITVNCQAAFIRKLLARCFCWSIGGDNPQCVSSGAALPDRKCVFICVSEKEVGELTVTPLM